MMQIGEGFAGSGAEAAHVTTVLGPGDGPVGTAWATALASPSAGHVAFQVVLRPGLAVKPPTLLVPKAALAGDTHARLTWGAAQAGVAAGVMEVVAAQVIGTGGLVLLAAVWVDPGALDEEAVFANNRAATSAALRSGAHGGPALDEVLAHRDRPSNLAYP